MFLQNFITQFYRDLHGGFNSSRRRTSSRKIQLFKIWVFVIFGGNLNTDPYGSAPLAWRHVRYRKSPRRGRWRERGPWHGGGDGWRRPRPGGRGAAGSSRCSTRSSSAPTRCTPPICQESGRRSFFLVLDFFCRNTIVKSRGFNLIFGSSCLSYDW